MSNFNFYFYHIQNAVLESLKQKANIVKETFDSVDGISCNAIQGAMYCFPSLDLPQKLIDHAKVLWCEGKTTEVD